MTKGWEATTLGELCALTSGGTPSKDNPHFWTGSVPFVSARDLKSDRIDNSLLHISQEAVEQSATKIAPIGSLLMLVRGMGLANGIQIGEVIAPVAFNQDIRALHPPLDSVLPRFLLLALRNGFMNGEGERVLSSAAHGTLKIDTDALRQIVIPLPPLPEQQRIVRLIDEAFDGIATAKANAEKNLQNAHAIFDSHLQSVFTQRGPGWAVRKLGDICSIARGGSPRPIKQFLTSDINGINWIKIGDATASGKYIYETEEKIIPDGAKRSRMVKDGDFLLSNSMSFGRPYIMRTSGCIHDGWLVLSDYASRLDQDYLYYVLGSGAVYQQFDRLAAGSTVRNLNIELASRVEVPVPPLARQREIAVQCETFSDETQHLATIYQRKLDALDALRRSLLNEAFTGQL